MPCRCVTQTVTLVGCGLSQWVRNMIGIDLAQQGIVNVTAAVWPFCVVQPLQ